MPPPLSHLSPLRRRDVGESAGGGEPGPQTLQRGFRRLAAMTEGYHLARQRHPRTRNPDFLVTMRLTASG
jgi:hypothetical protein